ncbi:hypothetical protein PIB30_003553 [Stylosanthes scabra]|uniref:FAR1 domain-containing protein n=1 Tax=Stylosanthes scabra TaxID=79078 RepID=A0ABU6X510_9FABA|nr:hypothetical protein [Stylosanthes scabra]
MDLEGSDESESCIGWESWWRIGDVEREDIRPGEEDEDQANLTEVSGGEWENGTAEEEATEGNRGEEVEDQNADCHNLNTTGETSPMLMESAEFQGIEETYERYGPYSREKEFAVRKGDAVKDEQGNIVRKFFYCNRQGLREKRHYERVDRKRAHKAETRTNCKAKLVVYLDKGTWK